MNDLFIELLDKNNDLAQMFKRNGIECLNQIYFEVLDLLNIIQGMPYFNDQAKKNVEFYTIYNLMSINLLIISQKSGNNYLNITKDNFNDSFYLQCNDVWINFSNRVCSKKTEIYSLEKCLPSINSDVMLFYKLIQEDYPTEKICEVYELLLLRCLFLLSNKQTNAATDILQAMIIYNKSNQLSDAIMKNINEKIDVKSLIYFFDYRLYSSSTKQWKVEIDNCMVMLLHVAYIIDFKEVTTLNLETQITKSINYYLNGYIKAFNSISNNEYESGIVFNELSCTLLDQNVPKLLKLNIRLLMSKILSNKKKHHMSLEILKTNLKENPFCLISLFELSLQFNQLKLFDAEFKILELLAKQANKETLSLDSKCPFLLKFLTQLIPNFFPTTHKITSSQVTLYQGIRLYQLQRFEDAIPFFNEIFEMNSHIKTKITGDQMTHNDYRDIYTQFIRCYIQTKHYEAAQIMCMKKLNHLTDMQSDKLDLLSMFESHFNKRQGYDQEEMLFEFEIKQLAAEVEFNRGKKKDAINLLSDAIKDLESIYVGENTLNCQKKLKLVDEQNATINQCKIVQLLNQMYLIKSSYLDEENDLKSALDCLRKAMQLNYENKETAMHLYRLLLKLNMKREATIGWLKYRKIKCDKVTLDNLCHDASINESKESAIDIECAKYVLNADFMNGCKDL